MMPRRLTAARSVLPLAGVLVAVVVGSAYQERVNPQAKALATFLDAVKKYVELHERLESKVPDLPKDATPVQIDQRQRALAALIQDARKGAAVGEVFDPVARPYLRKLLYGIFAGPDGKRLRISIQEENPGAVVKLRVNGRYPDTIPFSTVPPQVLRNLPPLPDQLEYRFIDRTLILLDAHAHIIVDYMTGAVPR
jgi:hypothetical protein